MTPYRTRMCVPAALLAALAAGCTEQPKPPPAGPRSAVPTATGPAAAGTDRGSPDRTEAAWLRAARDPDPKTRAAAAADADQFDLRADTAVPVLIELLRNDPADEVRWAVPQSFKRFGPRHRPEVVTALCDAMLTDRHDWVRSHTAMALAGIAFDDRAAARPAVPALTRAIGDKAARVNAAMALANLGRDANPAVPAVLQALVDPAVRRSMLNVLDVVDLGPDAAPGVPALAACLKSPEHTERRDAAALLRRIGPAAKEAIPALTEALRDPDPEVAKAAAAALARVDPAAKPPD